MVVFRSYFSYQRNFPADVYFSHFVAIAKVPRRTDSLTDRQSYRSNRGFIWNIKLPEHALKTNCSTRTSSYQPTLVKGYLNGIWYQISERFTTRKIKSMDSDKSI